MVGEFRRRLPIRGAHPRGGGLRRRHPLVRTDGVDEALAPTRNLYTTERAIELFANATGSAADIGRALLADVRKHANGRDQNDDIAIMVFGRNP